MVDAELNCAFADREPHWHCIVTTMTSNMHAFLARADLVQSYLQVFQMQCHVVDWQLFSKNWADAGRDASRMSPTNEILALAIQVSFLERCASIRCLRLCVRF
jgi:hypothetical protein